jgi:ArsR family transcriptional regulator
MGTTKTLDYTQSAYGIAKYAKALSHPARVAILEVLLKRTECICGEIVNEIQLSQSTISQHLKELKEAGLIKGEVEGVSTCYCIDQKEWNKAKLALSKFFDRFKACNETCC